MLLPQLIVIVLADVIANVMADVFTICGRWNSHFICDGMRLLPWQNNSLVENCGQTKIINSVAHSIWPLTLMYIDSLISLERLCSLNKNIGKYHLPHMWDEVLNNQITSAHICPHSTKWLYHLPQGNNISPSHIKWLFHLPHMVKTSAITLAITSANTITINCGNNISHTWQ